MANRRIHFSKEDIGGEILPILTTGLYRDTLDALREYIQNSIDADAKHIDLSVDPDVVSVTDDGRGMDRSEARKAMRLGISEKNPLLNVGFRGIGIYSAFNLCDSLEIFTKSIQEDTTYRLFFDFSRIRRELLAEQERRNQGKPPELYLERLLENSVFMEPSSDGIINGHGTKALMNGLLPESYRRLNDWDQVVEYLQNVVPLPFSSMFKFGKTIEEKFAQEDYRVVPLTLQMGDRREPLFRPYTDSVFRRGGQHPPEFFDVKDSRQSFGFAWICLNDAREVIKDRKIRGLLIKKFGFSIGDRQYLEPYFVRTVYSRRITGEVVIKHPNLIPNAARSDFENNATRQAFLEALPKFTRSVDQWANEIQEDDRAKEVLAQLTSRLSEINGKLPELQRDREQLLRLNAELADIDRRLKIHVKRLQTSEKQSLDKTRELLKGVGHFVREALLSQRRAKSKVEQEVIKAVQREALEPTPNERARAESIPSDLLSLLEAYDLLDSPQLRRALEYLDENVLKIYLDQQDYIQAIREFRDHLEESL